MAATMNIHKYRAFPQIELPDRKWPSRVIDKAPIWCSVDLRDGNQALPEPMGTHRKLKMFQHLVALGFKEIEVGFPAASDTDYDFIRHIIDEKLIPADVTIQVLTQAREPLIRRTMESIKGAPTAIVHLYNSTSTLQRRVVFGLDRAGVAKIATDAAELIRELTPEVAATGTKVRYQYSPESFTGTELDYARDICVAVMDVWRPSPSEKVIINLPATVEMSTANLYADMIEWMDRNLPRRDAIILSLHPHNDRGTGVAAAELGVMAGADRIEGTLFGNGERTGNVDVVTLALNLFSQGVDPKLDFSRINESVEVAEYCNQLPVHPRHPYAGELVYTAFSGSHQDAIKKGMKALEKSNSGLWEVPYLPIDPKDVGRSYEAIIRVNSQSGKGGVSYLLEAEYGIEMPRELQAEFSLVVQEVTDRTGKEVSAREIYDLFRETYVDRTAPYELLDYRLGTAPHASEIVTCKAKLKANGAAKDVAGQGDGPIDAFFHALEGVGVKARFLDYHQHAMGAGSDVSAVCFIKLENGAGRHAYGVGIHANTNTASMRAIVSAVNRLAA
jgi:2-isopropylmalate synthase